MRVIVFLTLASLFFGTMTAPAAQEYKGQIKLAWPGSSDVITVSLPGKSRMLEINAPGFKTETSRTEPDGRRYVEATNSVSGVILSAFFSYIDPSEKSVSCRNSLQQWTARNMWLHPTDVKSAKLGDAKMVEYLIPEVHGKPIEQKNVFACLAKDGFFADIHVSKVQFKPDEESMLISIVKAAHFKDALETDSSSVVVLKPGEASEASVPGPALGSMAYFREGGAYYLARRFDKAIGPFQKALDLEKRDPNLSKSYWRGLVDMLGMSYGITGDLKRAQATLEYGISKDSAYPNFYYNMACVYAERDDLENTTKYLRTAFKYKANVIPGEKMPDPRQDDSFQRFMKNEKFRNLVDQLTGPSM